MFESDALFRGIKVAKHPFYTIGPEMMFGSVSEHFANLRNVKYAKLVFERECPISGYGSCEDPFYSIGPKVMLRSVSEHSANLENVKMQNLCFGPECTISGYRSCEASILVHWTRNDVWECFGAFR
jgi:hypothetical protein